ncbi:3'-5' exonuclease [Kitasatospora sp. HPMI-4]|uniref:3'-5' exonuclease n=1 Tax=Kitasatospora sp. HPMI-4 TaxID=3448443 RepID=UPI003F1B42BB
MAAKKKQAGFGPVQLGNEVGLAQWQVERGQKRGLVPRPALASGRWSDEQAAELKERAGQVREVLGDHPGYGARRTAELLEEATGVEGLQGSDVEELVERGLLTAVGEYDGWPLYDPRDVAAFTDTAVLQEVMAARHLWVETSMSTASAAERCGLPESGFESAAREKGLTAGRFERWAVAVVEQVAGRPEPPADPRACRLLGPEQAVAYLGVRRLDLDRCVEAGWIAPYTHSLLQVGYRKTVRVPKFVTWELDALLAREDVDWTAVRATPAGRPSVLGRRGPTRADLVHAFVGQVLTEQHGVTAWARFRNASDIWTIDWIPTETGTPAAAQVRELLDQDPQLAPFSKKVRLLGDEMRIVHWARQMLQPGRAVLCDTETVDLWGAVCEIAVVDCATGEVLLDTLVNPGVPISEGAREVHGISDADVASAPTWDLVLPRLLEVTRGRTVLAYNAEYDRSVTVSDTRRLGLDPQHLGKADTWDCVMEALADWDGSGRWSPLGGGHRALGDAGAALRVLHELAEPPQWCVPKKLRRPAPVAVGA